MTEISEFVAMGGHAGFIWPAWAIAVVVLAGLIIQSLQTLRAREAELAALEAARPPRRRRGPVGPANRQLGKEGAGTAQ
jgi:heme exporter protein D